MQYLVHNRPDDADWTAAEDAAPWADTPAATLHNFMGDRPAHFPRTRVRMLYDEQAVYLRFDVRDHYVRAAAEHHQQPVCRDSCVEFFFNPRPEEPNLYFNLEMNCGGVMLFHFHPDADSRTPVAESLMRQIQVAASLPRQVNPEVARPTHWHVAYRLPLDVVSSYTSIDPPAPGNAWRANFYKCADETSHPHWLTWAPVRRPQPDFHVPDNFGTLRFVP